MMITGVVAAVTILDSTLTPGDIYVFDTMFPSLVSSCVDDTTSAVVLKHPLFSGDGLSNEVSSLVTDVVTCGTVEE